MIVNKHIILDEEMSEFQVKRKAEKMWGEYNLALGDTVYFYIEQEEVSDLFIGQKHSFERCTDDEWRQYFREYIGIPPKPKPLPKFINGGLRYPSRIKYERKNKAR